jgi:MoaA/NifB/PqqE/SkfB family radical SAM enzyme
MIHKQILRKSIFFIKTSIIFLKYKLSIPVPFLIIVVPTGNCNLRCKYCEYYHKENIPDYGQMSYPMLRKIIDQIYNLGIPMISFSGGEPLLCKDIIKTIKYAHKKGIIINLNTNGTLINKKQANKLTKYCDYIRISINGCETEHEKITQIKKSFSKTAIGLKHLINTKNRFAKIGINIIYKQGKEKRILETIQKFKNSVDFFSILPRFSFIQNKQIKLEKISKELLLIINRYKKIILNYKFILKANSKNNNIYCDYGILYATIYPTGAVMGCPFLTSKKDKKHELGNINYKTLNQILKKARIKKKPNCQGCYATCTTTVSQLFNKSHYKLENMFKFLIK